MNKGTSLELWRKGRGCSLGLSESACRSSVLLRIRIMSLLKLPLKGIGEDEENTF